MASSAVNFPLQTWPSSPTFRRLEWSTRKLKPPGATYSYRERSQESIQSPVLLKRSESCPQSPFLISKAISLQTRPKPTKKQTRTIPSEADYFPYPDPEDIADCPEFTKKIAVLRKYVEETRKQEMIKSYGKSNSESTTSSKPRRSISSDMGSQITLHHSSSTTALRRNDSECAPKGNRDNGKNVKKRTSLPCVLTSVEFPLLQGAAKPKDPGQTSTGKEDKPKGPFLQARKQQHRVKSAGIAELKRKSKLEISTQSKQLSPHQKNIKQKANKGTKGSRPLSAIT